MAVELLSPAISRATQEDRDRTDTRLRQIEARLAQVEQKPKPRDWLPIIISLISLVAALATICLNSYFTYKIQWNPLFTETHLLNAYVTDVTVSEDRLGAEVIFSNEGTQTEVVYAGKLIYADTNAAAWNSRYSQSTNSISPFILKAGDMNHVQISEPLLEGQRPPFKLGIFLKTLSNGIPTDVSYLLGVVSRPQLPLRDEAGRELLNEKKELIFSDAKGIALTASSIITIPLLDHQKRRKR